MIVSWSDKTKRVIFVAGLVSILVSAQLVAWANAPAPPSLVWFRFEDPTAQPLTPTAVQLIACEAAGCEPPVLLLQYGVCDAPDCLESPPVLTGWPSALQCARERCRAAIAPFTYVGTDFRIIAQFADGTRTSKVIDKLPDKSWGAEAFWRVVVHETTLEGVPSADLANKMVPAYGFLMAFILTQLSEVSVAALYCRVRLKMDPREMLKTMLKVLMINLATFPVVWLFYPHLQYLAPTSARYFGVGVLFVALGYAALLVYVCRARDTAQRMPRIALAVVALLIALGALLLFGFTTSYSLLHRISTRGVSFAAATAMAETFAVIAEAALLFLCSRERISLLRSVELSLAMNVVSMVLGVLLWQAW